MITKNWTSLLGRFSLVLVLIVMELGFMPVDEAFAATLTVTNTNDSGPGSLRQAVADAVSGDVITFDPSLAGETITLASDIVMNPGVTEMILTIDGSGLTPQVTISGGDVAHLQFSTRTNITISDLTIVHGLGGGIVSGGQLTVSNSTLKNNHTVGYGDGGAINSSGMLTVKNSTITQNQADSGGGIFISGNGSISILNSTIAQNTASTGGGIRVLGNVDITVNNTTFASNSAVQGAEIDLFGPAIQLLATNSIFVCTPDNSDCYTTGLSSVSLTDSILGVGTLYDYGLATLADNGGPTHTMALLPGSPLIDAGNDTGCAATDQRGSPAPRAAIVTLGPMRTRPLFAM